MLQVNSLRFRVAFLFALFGVGLSILFSGGVFLSQLQIGHQLMDDTLRAELNEHAAYPIFDPPKTATIKGYILSATETTENIPDEIRSLPPGSYDISIGKKDFRVLVADMLDKRYFLTFDTKHQHLHDALFVRYLVIFALFMIVSSTLGGLWLAIRVTTPVTRLAEQVGQAKAGDANLFLPELKSNDEVGELARAFDRYLRRLHDFIERENYFTADVSHELRTPLAIMLGSVEVLEQDESLSPKQKERIARIRRAAQDMTELTSALLLLAREQQQAVDDLPCNVAEVVRSSVEKHLHLLADRPLRMEMELVAEPEIFVERPLLEIVIGNLIRNALFNTKTGYVLLRLEQNSLIVRDTGVGMRPDELARALDRYYKGASSVGSGVGLSLVKRICERYGWRIFLDSREGQGTTAKIVFSA